MIVGINCGHTKSGAGSGASGFFSESEHTRHVGYALMNKLRSSGVEVVDCTIDTATTQAEYLEKAVNLANNESLDWFISIHFNASKGHDASGVEVYTYKGRQYPDALEVCQNLSALGFKNRGVKDGSGLHVIRKTKAKSLLIEVCFCDNQTDANFYATAGVSKVVDAIYNALCDYVVSPSESGTTILGESEVKAEQLNALLLAHNASASHYLHLADIFIEEGKKEGIRGDIAFCQALKETGYFKFGGDVKPDQHNYCGLGATGGVPGLSFPDDITGIRAQIQHLKAYATAEPLIEKCVDPRYGYVKKGCAPTWESLSGKWAVPGYSGYTSLEEAAKAKDTYGHHIVSMWREAKAMDVDKPQYVKQDSLCVISCAEVWTKEEAEKALAVLDQQYPNLPKKILTVKLV